MTELAIPYMYPLKETFKFLLYVNETWSAPIFQVWKFKFME